MSKEAALSSKGEFDNLLQVVLSSQENNESILRIWKATDEDFKSS
jgi:hypothetical protein